MKRVIELIRVSTEQQAASDRASIPAQREVNRRTVAAYGLTIVRSIELTDVSGAQVIHAPEMQLLLSLIQSPDVHGVVAREFSRLMRPEHFGDFAMLQAFIDSKTVLYLPDGPIDFTNKTGRFLGGIRALMAGLERSEILERMWSAKEEKRRRGENPQSRITLATGVTYAAGKWAYNERATLIREAFRRFLAGEHNYSALSRLVGVTPRGMHLILRNPIYTGWRVIDKRRDLSPGAQRIKAGARQGDRRKIKRAPEEIIKLKVMDGIVSEADFQTVQQVMDARSLRHYKNWDGYEHRFTYTGFARCTCGSFLQSRNERRGDFYRCKGRPECKAPLMKRETMEEMLDCFICGVISTTDVITAIVERFADRAKQADAALNNQRMRDEVSSLSRKRDRVLDAFVDGTIDKVERDRRLSGIDAQLSKASSTMIDWQPELDAESLARLLAPLLEFPALQLKDKRALLAAVMPEIHIKDYVVSGISLACGAIGNHSHAGTDFTAPAPSLIYIPLERL